MKEKDNADDEDCPYKKNLDDFENKFKFDKKKLNYKIISQKLK